MLAVSRSDDAAADATSRIASGLAKVIRFFMQDDGVSNHPMRALVQREAGNRELQHSDALLIDGDIAKIAGVRSHEPVLGEKPMLGLVRIEMSSGRVAGITTVTLVMEMDAMDARRRIGHPNRGLQAVGCWRERRVT